MTKSDLIKYIIRGIGWASLAALAVGFVLFERVNYITTYESLLAIFGQHVWIVILSWGIVLVDLAALVKIFTPSLDRGKDLYLLRALLIIWLTVSMLDIVFNWYFAALQMEANVSVVPSAVGEYIWVLPIITALVIWGVQFGLLYTLGQMLERALNQKPQVGAILPTFDLDQLKPIIEKSAGGPVKKSDSRVK